MKTDFSINVQINVGVTPEVVALVSSILNRQPAAVAATPAVESADSPEPAKPARRASKKTTDPKPEETAPAKDPDPEPEPTKDPEPENKELTAEDVREAMHRTRQRIEGEDYKENTESEGYKKYHRELTAIFKQISALLGSDKPSTLPADQRAGFISRCDALELQADGKISEVLPF